MAIVRQNPAYAPAHNKKALFFTGSYQNENHKKDNTYSLHQSERNIVV